MPQVIESPATAREMLHPEVLKLFGGACLGSVYPYSLLRASGFIDIRFPDMFQAAAWAKVWAEESGSEPPVHLQLNARLWSTERKLSNPVTVTVTDDTEGG